MRYLLSSGLFLTLVIVAVAVEKSPRSSSSESNRKDTASKATSVESKSGDQADNSAAAALAKNLQPAKWIWNEKRRGAKSPGGTVYFRKEFAQRGGIPSARVYMVSSGEATVWVDGEKMLTHSGRDAVGVKDVTDIFNREVPGNRHTIAVEVKQPANGQPPGMMLSIVYSSGWRDPWAIVSDQSWITSTQGGKGWEQVDFDSSSWKKAKVLGGFDEKPWQLAAGTFYASANLRPPTATPIDDLRVAKGFQVELLYSVPKDRQGSWVNLCTDPKGRLIVSDQYGGLYRVTPPAIGEQADPRVEKIPVDLGEAQGLLWAFDSLYVVVNKTGKYQSGLHRVRDTDGDDVLDSAELLRGMEGVGEHGPHAVLLSPDGKSLHVVCGNSTKPTEVVNSQVPAIWDEDQLLPRIYGRGFMRGTAPPGGCIYRTDPDGKEWVRVAAGFRNEFDAAFNADGELFTYDADMEWDMNTPWYRPTRICHVVSGVDYGWRNGSAKWPVYYPDTLPPVIDIGPGSPTGVCFGYGAKFPEKMQNALFICDWTYGKLDAVHLQPQGASYSAVREEFISGTPLPLTDVTINPHDGAMYFTIGGRKIQSGLYRVTYIGEESTEPAVRRHPGKSSRDIRRRLEAFHGKQDPQAIEAAWSYLSSEDRFLRYAARTAIEHQPLEQWQDRALAERRPDASLAALLALVRKIPRSYQPEGPDLDTPPPTFPAKNAKPHPLLPQVIDSLERLNWSTLKYPQRIELLRVYGLALYRLGPPDEELRQRLIGTFDAIYPAQGVELNSQLTELLCWLQAPSAAEKGIALLTAARTQEEQIGLAKSLRFLTAGWTPELRRSYLQWFVRALGYSGGANFMQFMQELKGDAVARIPEDQKAALTEIINAAPPKQPTAATVKPRPFVKEWTMEELAPLVQNGLTGRNFDRGREMFAAANCFACHRFANEGGAIGPDLTILSGRFSRRDILESVLEPSKAVSDQYQAVQIVTLEGKVVVGRIVNLAGDVVQVNTNMLNPNELTAVDRNQIDEMVPSKVSMMPKGLLNTLNRDEVLDLMAFLLSRGDRDSPMFRK